MGFFQFRGVIYLWRRCKTEKCGLADCYRADISCKHKSHKYFIIQMQLQNFVKLLQVKAEVVYVSRRSGVELLVKAILQTTGCSVFWDLAACFNLPLDTAWIISVNSDCCWPLAGPASSWKWPLDRYVCTYDCECMLTTTGVLRDS